MLKPLLLIILSSLLLSAENSCNNKTTTATAANDSCFKGRLEIKGICSNYTIRVVEGRIDTSLVAANWHDENTGKEYTNVFALDSPCSFPSDINEGDEFYFTINPQKDKDCNVCMAYYPTPQKKLAIKVFKAACK